MGGFNKILNYVRYEILKGKAFQKCRINVNGLRWGKKTKTNGEELSIMEETEETLQVVVMCNPGWDIGPKKAYQWDN